VDDESGDEDGELMCVKWYESEGDRSRCEFKSLEFSWSSGIV